MNYLHNLRNIMWKFIIPILVFCSCKIKRVNTCEIELDSISSYLTKNIVSNSFLVLIDTTLCIDKKEAFKYYLDKHNLKIVNNRLSVNLKKLNTNINYTFGSINSISPNSKISVAFSPLLKSNDTNFKYWMICYVSTQVEEYADVFSFKVLSDCTITSLKTEDGFLRLIE